MALIIADRVKETTITSGGGRITLSGATFGGFQTFSDAIGDGNTTYYCIQNFDKFEIGLGVYRSSDNTLSRDTVLQSSNSDNLISLTGASVVFCVIPADKSLYINESGDAELPVPLTLKRSDSGDYWQTFSTDHSNRVASFYIHESADPTWKIGLKTTSSDMVAPYYAYVSAKDGFVELRGNSSSILSIGDGNSEGLQVNHQFKNVIDIRKNGGEIAIQNLDLNSDETTTAKNTSIAYTVFSVESSASHAADLQTWSVTTDEKASLNQYGDFETVGNVISPSGKFSAVRFSDTSIQTTAGLPYSSGSLIDQNTQNIVTNSGYFQSYIDSRDVAISGWTEGYIDQTSGNLQFEISQVSSDLSSTSGYFESRVDQLDSDVSYVSGIAVFASGHNLQSVTDNGSVTTNAITVNNNITASSGLFDSLDMTPIAEANYPPHQEGVLFYDNENHTLSLYNDEADVTLQLGQEEFLRVRNNTGATIENGTAVLINGAHGNAAPTISGAIANSESSSQVVGLATHSIENNSFGYVTTYGIVRDIDTSSFSAGDEIFLSATEVGSGVNVSPVIPNYKVTIGHVIRSHSNGSVLVQVGHPKLGGGDLKSESVLNLSGVPFVSQIADTTAGGSLTDSLFVFDSGNRQLQLGSGLQLLDGQPSNTTNVLYNDGGDLYFNGSEIGVSGESLDFAGNILTYNNSKGGSFTADLSSLSTFDTSGVSLGYSAGTLTYTNNAGGSFDVDLSSISGDVYAMIVDGAPTTLDTLNEIAAALNDDANLANTLTNLISTTSGNLQTQITSNDGDVATVSGIAAKTFTVTASSSTNYTFDGMGLSSASDPTIYLHKGHTYYFDKQTSSHPLRISASDGGSVYQDADGNNVEITGQGILTFEVPQNAPDKLYYYCTSHPSSMKGLIYTTADGSLSGYFESRADQADADISTVSGLLYDDTAISGYFESRSDESDANNSTVSGLLYNYWTVSDGTNSENILANQQVTFSGVGGSVVSYDSSSNTVSISGASDPTGVVSGISFFGDDGILTGNNTFTYDGQDIRVSGAIFSSNATFNSLLNVSGVSTFGAGVKTKLNSESDGATITFDMDQSNTHSTTLGGNRTLAVSNVDAGQKFTIRLAQDGTGNREVNWWSNINWIISNSGEPTLNSGVNEVDYFGFLCTSGGYYDGFHMTELAAGGGGGGGGTTYNIASGLPYASGEYYLQEINQNAADIVTVSGLIGTGGGTGSGLPYASGDYYLQEIRTNSASGVSISGTLQPQITQNSSDIVVVSGLIGAGGGGLPYASGDYYLNSINTVSGLIPNNTFNITGGDGSNYTIDGMGLNSASDPTMYLHKGHTYVFNKTFSGHPFAVSATDGGSVYSDADGTNIEIGSSAGSVTFEVPQDAPDKLYYYCTAHPSNMKGVIYTTTDGSLSGYFESRVDTNAADIITVSGLTGGGGGTTYTAGSGLTLVGDEFNTYGGSGNFEYIELQTDNTVVPKLKFTGSGVTDTPITLEVRSSYESASESGSALLFQGSQGQLFSITDNLSSGVIFSVADIAGLPMLEVDASGHVHIGEYADDITAYKPILISGGVPASTTNKLYNDAGTLKFNGSTVGGSSYTAGSGLTLVGTEFNVYGGSGNFEQILFTDENVKIGTDSYSTSSGVSIGYQAGSGFTGVGPDNIFIGTNAGSEAHVSSDKAVCIGYNAGRNGLVDYGAIMGMQAGKNQYARNAVFLGYQAGYASAWQSSLNSYNAIGIGTNSLIYAQGAVDSIALGGSAGRAMTGDANFVVGVEAGYNITGDNNIELRMGKSGTSIIGSSSDKLHIQEIIIGDTSSKLLAIGNVGSADLTPDATLEIKPNAATDVGLIVQAATSHSASLQEWQNSSETKLLAVGPDGGLELPNNVPSTTTNKLYNNAGTLYYNGSSLVYNDASLSGYFESRADQDDVDLAYISGVAVYASGLDNYLLNPSGVGGISITSDVDTVVFSGDATLARTLDLNYVSGVAVYASGQITPALTAGSGITIDSANQINVHGGSGHFINLELTTDADIVPKMVFTGSGVTDTPIRMKVLSSYASASTSGTALAFEGTEGQLFGITDNLSSGKIFSVNDITGLPLISVDASGDVELAEFGRDIIAHKAITLQSGVPSITTNKLYNDGYDLYYNGSSLSYTAGSGLTLVGGEFNVHGGSGHFINLDVDGAFTATTKSFLIDHPSKEGMKLQYGSLEGPENGVYVRGTTNNRFITLPSYWRDLVNSSSITVSLTCLGSFQPLFVEQKNNREIIVGGVCGYYDYVVYGERKDVEKLKVEW